MLTVAATSRPPAWRAVASRVSAGCPLASLGGAGTAAARRVPGTPTAAGTANAVALTCTAATIRVSAVAIARHRGRNAVSAIAATMEAIGRMGIVYRAFLFWIARNIANGTRT